MSVNREKPHLVILPEDAPYENMSNGFINHINNVRLIQVLPFASGWLKTVDKLTKEQVPEMRRFSQRMVLLLIDFDQDKNRMEYIIRQIPIDLKERVFILGVWSESEKLKNCKNEVVQSFEKIGESLAQACINDDDELWQHELLKHNLKEIERMKPSVKPLLFSP